MDVLASTKKGMFAAKHESEFASAVDQLVESFPKSLALVQFWAGLYAELNRETKLFDALARLFDLSVAHNQIPGACEALEKLVEIDPYDSRNQERFDQLQGRADENFLKRVRSRLSNAATHGSSGPNAGKPRGKSEGASAAGSREFAIQPDARRPARTSGNIHSVLAAIQGHRASAAHRGNVSGGRRT